MRPFRTVMSQQSNLFSVSRMTSMSCGGILLLPSNFTSRYFSSTSSSSGAAKKQNTGIKKKKISSFGTFFKKGKEKHVRSASLWDWHPFCTQFAELKSEQPHDPSLALPKARTMEPAMQVFAQLDIDERILLNPPKGSYAFEHCGIKKKMLKMKLPTMSDGSPNPDIFEKNQIMVEQLSSALKQECLSQSPQEGKIDECSHQFLHLCGFNRLPFMITAEKSPFTIFGRTCTAVADQYVVHSQNKDLVLIFEDKALADQENIVRKGHLGQIVAEMLQCLSLNRAKDKGKEKKAYRNVFAIRYINYHVTGFRINIDAMTLDALVDEDFVPKKKLQLQCTLENPVEEVGWSLIDKDERLKALKMMADIRKFILEEI